MNAINRIGPRPAPTATDRLAQSAALALLVISIGALPPGAADAQNADAGGGPQIEPGSFTIAVMPDTQIYAARHPQHFRRQTEWIAEHAGELNIRYVLHLGDITHNNTPKEWRIAREAMGQLDGRVPYAVTTGNHDHGKRGRARDRSTKLNEFFHVKHQREWPTFGGVMEDGRLQNNYHTFTVNGQSFLILALEWGPRDKAVEWANRVVAEHPDHRVLMITHAYLYHDNRRYDWQQLGDEQRWNPHSYGTADHPGGTNDGQELWDKLVRRHPNFMMTFNGHVLGDGTGRRTDAGQHGNRVHQMLVNFQVLDEGGNGYLRLIEFLPDGKTVRCRTYSPSLDQFKTDSQNQFRLKLNPPLNFKE